MKTLFKLSLTLLVLLAISCGKDDDASCTEQIWYQDADGDGFGNANQKQSSCTQPNGYVSDNTDFNDNDGNSFPNATEVCDGIDNDGDGQVDGLSSSSCGVGEVCENGSCVAATTYYLDADNDGYGDATNSTQAGNTAPTGYVLDNTDCDDTDASTNPGVQEIQDGLDNDCDGLVDECIDDSACDDGDPNTYDYCNNGHCTSVPYCANDNDCPPGTTCVDLGGGLKVCQ